MSSARSRRKKPNLRTLDGAQENLLRMLHSARNEDVLGIVILGHLLLEATMRELLETALLYPMPEETFERKLNLRIRSELCVALGLMAEPWLAPIKAIIDLRNEFAHYPTYDVSNAVIGGLIGALPELGRDIYKANGRGATKHARLVDFFMALFIALNTHISILKTNSHYARRKARQAKPPHEMLLRMVINMRNSTFEIPDLTPDGKKVGQVRTIPIDSDESRLKRERRGQPV